MQSAPSVGRGVEHADRGRRGLRSGPGALPPAEHRIYPAPEDRRYAASVPKRVLILGSTGSIGEQALDVVAGSDELELAGLSAGGQLGAARRAGARARRRDGRARRPRGRRARRARELDGVRVLAGEEGVRELIVDLASADLVLNAIVGAAGLGPTIVALTEGIDLALANKESLVVGGELVTALAEATGTADPAGRLRALGALPAARAPRRPGTVDRLILTASGGPFRGRTDLAGVTRRRRRSPTRPGRWAGGSRSTRRR